MEIVSQGLTMVPENRRLFARMTVRENLELGSYLRKDRPKVNVFFFKQKTAYEISTGLEFRRVLFRSTLLSTWPNVTVLDLAPGALVYGVGQGAIGPVLFRVILSGVPTEAAGAGSGVLTTTQQTALALGVASLGMRDALVLTITLMAALSVVIGLVVTRLPDPRQATA